MLGPPLSRRRLMAMAGAGALGAALGTGTQLQPASAQLATEYELIDLGVTGPSPRNDVGFIAMNDAGVAIGSVFIDLEKDSPWVWSDGNFSRIRTGQYGARVSSINSSGVIGGREIIAWESESSAIGRPVQWRDGEKEVLPYPQIPGANFREGQVSGIADDGRVFGYGITDDDRYFPITWVDGEPQPVETIFPEGMGWFSYVNRRGAAVGGSVSATEGIATLWDNGVPVPVQHEQIPGMTDWTILGLDDHDRLLGTVMWEGRKSAVWADGPFSQPQLLSDVVAGQEASLVRCAGSMVLLGGAITVGGREHAAVWMDDDGVELRELVKNTRGLRLLQVEHITSSGLIGLDGFDGDGNRHAVILTPV